MWIFKLLKAYFKYVHPLHGATLALGGCLRLHLSEPATQPFLILILYPSRISWSFARSEAHFFDFLCFPSLEKFSFRLWGKGRHWGTGADWSHALRCLWLSRDFLPWVIDSPSIWSSKAFNHKGFISAFSFQNIFETSKARDWLFWYLHYATTTVTQGPVAKRSAWTRKEHRANIYIYTYFFRDKNQYITVFHYA